MTRWGPTFVVLALLAGTAIAFATTERQKLEKTPFAVVSVTQDFSPKLEPAAIELKLHRSHALTARIIDSQDRVVATLARDERFPAGNVTFHWNGDVADGIYRPRVRLDDGRVFTLPNPIRRRRPCSSPTIPASLAHGLRSTSGSRTESASLRTSSCSSTAAAC